MKTKQNQAKPLENQATPIKNQGKPRKTKEHQAKPMKARQNQWETKQNQSKPWRGSFPRRAAHSRPTASGGAPVGPRSGPAWPCETVSLYPVPVFSLVPSRFAFPVFGSQKRRKNKGFRSRRRPAKPPGAAGTPKWPRREDSMKENDGLRRAARTGGFRAKPRGSQAGGGPQSPPEPPGPESGPHPQPPHQPFGWFLR